MSNRGLLFCCMVILGMSPQAKPQCIPIPGCLVGWWPGEANAADLVGPNNGTLMNGAGFAPGKVGQAFTFDGQNDYVLIADSPILSPHVGPEGEMSLEAWIWMPAYPAFDVVTGQGRRAVVAKGGAPPGNWEFALNVLTNRQVEFVVWNPNGTEYARTSGGTVTLSQWHHLVGTLKKGVFARIYLDGSEKAEDATFQGDTGDGLSPLFIGRRGDAQFFNGRVDEVSHYKRALTDSEVTALYAAGGFGKCRPPPPADHFADALALPSDCGSVRGSTIGTTREQCEPWPANTVAANSVWWKWTPAGFGIATVDTLGSSFDTLLGIYTGTSVSNLTAIGAGDDDRGGSLTSEVRFNATAGTTYYITVAGYGTDAGNVRLNWGLETTSDRIPVIKEEPAPQTVPFMNSANFQVAPEVPNNIEYQWLFNGVAIPNETNGSLVVPSVTMAHVGHYSVRLVNNTNTASRVVESIAVPLEIGSCPDTRFQGKALFCFRECQGPLIECADGITTDNEINCVTLLMAEWGRGAPTFLGLGVAGEHSGSISGEVPHDCDPTDCGNHDTGSAQVYYFTVTNRNRSIVELNTFDTLGGATLTNTLLQVRRFTSNTCWRNYTCVAYDTTNAIPNSVRFRNQRTNGYIAIVDGEDGRTGSFTINYRCGDTQSIVQPFLETNVTANGLLILSITATGWAPSPTFQWYWNQDRIDDRFVISQGLTSQLAYQVGCGSGGRYSVVTSNWVGSVTNHFDVRVSDNEAPTIACPANIVTNSSTGADNVRGDCQAQVTYAIPVPVDNCPGATAVCTPASGSMFPVGSTTVSCTATDAAGLVSVPPCTFIVTVNDDEPPVANCPANITINTDPGQCCGTTTSAPTAIDNCSEVAFRCVPALDSCFPKGTTTVTCTASDASGNAATCRFTVTVADGNPPPLLINPTIANGSFHCELVGIAGCTYAVDWTPNLTDWNNLTIINAVSANTLIEDRNVAQITQRFYRARSWP